MDGIYFAFGNIAVCIVIYWAMLNDNLQPAGGTLGLLAMAHDDRVPLIATASSRFSANGRGND